MTNSNTESLYREYKGDKYNFIWKTMLPDQLSKNFIREHKDIITWNRNTIRALIKKHGEKFYEELFGRRD